MKYPSEYTTPGGESLRHFCSKRMPYACISQDMFLLWPIPFDTQNNTFVEHYIRIHDFVCHLSRLLHELVRVRATVTFVAFTYYGFRVVPHHSTRHAQSEEFQSWGMFWRLDHGFDSRVRFPDYGWFVYQMGLCPRTYGSRVVPHHSTRHAHLPETGSNLPTSLTHCISI